MAIKATIDRDSLWEEVGYSPHAGQQIFHKSKARHKIAVCGRRFGKSMMASMEVLPHLFVPGTRGWIIGPDYATGEEEFRFLWEALMYKLGLSNEIKRKAYNVRTGEMYIQMPWTPPSRVDVKSAQYPDRLVSKGLDWVIISEASKQPPDVWKYVEPSLSDRKGVAYFPGTPEGYNWFWELYMKGQDPTKRLDNDAPWEDSWESWNLPSWFNTIVFPGGFDDPEIQKQMHSEDDPGFWQEVGANFRTFEGKVYTEWNDEKHIIKNYQYDPNIPNYIFYDPGVTNPFAALDVQVDSSDNVYVWREHYESGLTDHQTAITLRDRQNPPGYSIVCAFGDSASPNAAEELGSILCPTIAMGEAKDKQTGIQLVKKFLTGIDGKPQLFVDRSCENTIFEFQNYRRKQKLRTGEDRKEDDTVKIKDHAVDAIRYGLMHLYQLGARYHLSDVETSEPESQLKELQPIGEEESLFTSDGYEPVFSLEGRRF